MFLALRLTAEMEELKVMNLVKRLMLHQLLKGLAERLELSVLETGLFVGFLFVF